MIAYPDDWVAQAQAEKHGIPEEVLVRDLVRLVEVLNLRQQGFFSKDSVLSGSMALRCFNSPRFTVYDADFSTTVAAKRERDEMQTMLRYADDDLEISPNELVPFDIRGTAWKSDPVSYDPVFTNLAPNPASHQFKVDISNRGLVCSGQEQELLVPYELGIWEEPPVVWIMDPHEVVAEKTLGWVAHALVKHYADLAFIAIAAQQAANTLIPLENKKLRQTLADKLEAMNELQPRTYAAFNSVDDVVDALAAPPTFDTQQWTEIVYLKGQRGRYNQQTLINAVDRLLVPRLRP